MQTGNATTPTPATARLLEIVARLRGENGCPWDREQTLQTLKPYLVEECYELIDAIDSDRADRHADELGDVLLQVVLQAQIRAERGDFSFEDVASRLASKLVRRHPHVFGDVTVDGTDEVLRNWERIKSTEKTSPEASVLDGVPRHLPALQKAQRVQSRAARVGFDWEKTSDVVAKIDEELREVREALDGGDAKALSEEVGDLLFSAVNLCRFCHIQAEEALQGTVAKFMRRFGEIERRVRAEGRDLKACTLAELDAHWEAAKRGEREGDA